MHHNKSVGSVAIILLLAACIVLPSGCSRQPVGKLPSTDPQAKQGDPGKDEQQLQGKWRLLKVDHDGKDVLVHAPPQISPNALEITDKKVFFGWCTGVGGSNQCETINGSFTLDTAQSPRSIDLVNEMFVEKAEVTRGIYELDGDKLKIATFKAKASAARDKDFGRPKGFDDRNPDAFLRVFTLTRAAAPK
jgi:uncharacterized protein (TIGR03067 family)